MATKKEYGHPYEDKCPIVYSMELIGAKWKLPVMWYLTQEDGLHYNELRRRVHGVTNTILTKCLRELETDGLLTRHSLGTVPPSVTYHLTPIGRQLLPALNNLSEWGQMHMAMQAAAQE